MSRVSERELNLRFLVQADTELSPSAFVDLFRCAEALSRHVFERQSRALLDAINMPAALRLESLQRLHGLGRRVPVPGEVRAVERGSWSVVVTLYGWALIWVLKEYVHPVLREAWDESSVRDRLMAFLRDRIFGGARQQVEEKAVEMRRFGNLEIVEVSGDDSRATGGEVIVRLEQRHVIAIADRDKGFVEEFLRKLSG